MVLNHRICILIGLFLIVAHGNSSAFMGRALGSASLGSRNLSHLPISEASYNLILHHEVSSRSFYDEIYSKPTVPPEDSGVTIGIGYDLGQVDILTFQRDWGNYLPADQLSALRACVGLKRGAARSALRNVKHIVIPFEVAEQVFINYSLPDAINNTMRAFPGSEQLHPDIFGALVSLVFNRGGGLKDAPGSNRREEMRELRDLIYTGNLALIPSKFREMKRIWSKGKAGGLLRRREDEARLVESALKSSSPYMVAFDDTSRGRSLPRLPVLREIVPANEAEAEEIRDYFFHNAEAVANSLRERIQAVGGKNIASLDVEAKEDMLWLVEFKALVVPGKNGERVQTTKKGDKFVEVDITDLDFSEYPPSQVSRVLYLTQSLLNTKIPSPLLASWTPENKSSGFVTSNINDEK